MKTRDVSVPAQCLKQPILIVHAQQSTNTFILPHPYLKEASGNPVVTVIAAINTWG
jgi:hypothetical protein